MATIAELIIKARDEASAIMRQVQQSAKESGQAIKAAFEGLGKVGEDLAKIGAAGLGAFGLAAKSSANFQDELRNTMTATSLTGKQFYEMEGKVKDLANTIAIKYGTNGQEVLKSFYYVLSTGAEAGGKGFKTLSESALALSKIVGIDLSSSVSYCADISKIFGKSMEESAHTADILFKSSQIGNADVKEMADAMVIAGKAAAGMGISMEECAAVLINFADNGLKGAEAGTALRGILAKLAAPPKEAADALKALGVSIYDGTQKAKSMSDVLSDLGKWIKSLPTKEQAQAMALLGVSAKDASGKMKPMKDIISEIKKAFPNAIPEATLKNLEKLGFASTTTAGKMKPISQILKELQASFAGLSDEEKNNYLSAIAGQEYYATFGQLLRGNIEAIDGNTEAMTKSGAVQGAMAKKMETLNSQLNVLKESFMQVVRAVGDALLPSITQGVKALISFTQGVMDYIKQHPQFVALIAKWGTIGSAIALALGTALMGVAGFVAKAIEIAGTIGSLLAAAFSPIGIGIALMLAGVYASWQQNFGGIRDFTMEIVKVLQDSWGKLWEYMKQGKAEEMLTVFQGAWDKIKELFGTKIDEVKAKFQEFGAGIKAAFEPLKTAIAPAIQPISDGIKSIVSNIKDFLKDHPGFIAALKEWGPPLAAISGALVVITPLIGSLAGGMSSLLGPLGGVLLALRGIGLFFASNPLGIALGIFAALYAAWQSDLWGIQQIVKDTVVKVQEWWNGFLAWMQQSPAAGKAKEIWGALGKAITDAFAYLTGADFKSKIQAALDWLSGAWQKLVKFLQPVINEITKVLWPELVKIWDILVQAAKDFWIEFQPQLEQLWTAIKDLTVRIMELIGPYVPSILALLQTSLKLLITGIAVILNDFAKILKGTLLLISKLINDWILPLMTAIIKTIDDTIFGITESVKAIQAAIEKYFVKPIADAYAAYYKAKTQIIELWEGIKQAIDKALKYIASAIDKWVQDKFGYWIKKIEEIEKLISDVQALTNGTAGNGNAQFTNTGAAAAASTVSGPSGAAAAATAASKGLTLNNSVIITSSSSARQLEKELSKYTVQRLARGAV